ncbi:cytochrome c biogenesis protein ResB [Nakamurella flavida]|uniref:Cytochrome c biogenesis protein ResB n=1 Tax=Nakamurella flavida TaxID=363630 RepID=A0A938YM43_9ACTN|nr:cytochrome c biogenesis protein ResB [Nakamurella flavida]MBM9475759.1 cytochrome c biogenesis protein ResB [Nakamurella flavida]MDP9777961.1 cytochrome c biogenesis protein [Nakamurella flavida]
MSIQDRISTRDDTPDPQPPRPGQGPVRAALAFLRNTWRQLTSMRTALVLLFLLALASLPGALLPQWSLNAAKTQTYINTYPTLGPILDRLGFFEVFASPWYAAIYLLLFTSLVGCVLPRCLDFYRQLRQPPVATPRNLSRLPHADTHQVAGAPDEVADRVLRGLKGWRVTRREEPGGVVTVSAEKGYLREVGNLVFHLSLLGLLVAIAVGKLVGYEGSVILNAGPDVNGVTQPFCSTSPSNYDNFRPGLTIDGTDMAPFCIKVDSFDAGYTEQGQAIAFEAGLQYQSGADAGTDRWGTDLLQVNDPLRMGQERLYLLGHGFTPQFTVTYPDGTVRPYEAVFQPENGNPNFLSSGVVKVTDPPGWVGDEVRQHQLAVVGLFAPTQVIRNGLMDSQFPSPRDPGVAVDVYVGDLGLEGGLAQSVFTIDQNQVDKGALVKQARENLSIGQSITLDDGTVITFSGFRQWVALQTSYDPAQGYALVFAVLLLVGLMISLTVKRRRVWFRLRPVAAVTPTGSASASPPSVVGRTVVDVGGLARTDQAGYGEEFDRLVTLGRPDPAAGKGGSAR